MCIQVFALVIDEIDDVLSTNKAKFGSPAIQIGVVSWKVWNNDQRGISGIPNVHPHAAWNNRACLLEIS